MKRFLLSLCLIGTIALSVDAGIVWLEKLYDFGLFKEEAGPTTGHARFINTGPDEVCITGMRPSCGCTSVDYPKDPIQPGDTATVSFTYDPSGRPGRFEKSVRVYIGSTDTHLIKIRGNVLGTPASLSTLYPVVAGPLRLTTSNLFGGEVKHGTARHFFVNGYNHTPDTIHPKIISENKALSVVASSEDIGPGDIVAFSFYLNTRELPNLGMIDIPVRIYPDPKDESVFAEVHLTAEIQ